MINTRYKNKNGIFVADCANKLMKLQICMFLWYTIGIELFFRNAMQ